MLPVRFLILILMFCIAGCSGPITEPGEMSPLLSASIERFRTEVETRERQVTDDDLETLFRGFLEDYLDRQYAQHAFRLVRSEATEKPVLTVDRAIEVLGQPSHGSESRVGPRGQPVLHYKLSGLRVLRYVELGYDADGQITYAEYLTTYL